MEQQENKTEELKVQNNAVEALKALEQTHSAEDMLAAFFVRYENTLPKPIKNASLKQLQRVILSAIFGDLSKKDYKTISDDERALAFHIRQAIADRLVMEAVQEQIDNEKVRLALETKNEEGEKNG